MKKPELKDFIKKDPSELSNGQIIAGYQDYVKALEIYIDHLESERARETARKALEEFAPKILDSFSLYMHEEFGESVCDYGIKEFLKFNCMQDAIGIFDNIN